MADVRSVLSARLQAAYDLIEPGADPVLRPSERADFQSNGALPLAKRLGRDPRQVAEEIRARAELDDICAQVEVSGPGFLNLTLHNSFISDEASTLRHDERLGVPVVATPETVVVDYSAPNVAKEMHVGHLRTTVIGDSLCRVLDFVGHQVIRENHIGDWGTPFGMLIEHLVDVGEEKGVHEVSVGDLNAFYQGARLEFDADAAFRERSRRRVVLLQSGDPETLRLWQVLVGESLRAFDEVYAKLGVLLSDDDVVGESFYNPILPGVVDDLERAGLLVEDDGAQCVFPPGFTNRSGDPLPLIVRKSDGGYGYAATDLAAIRDRVDRLGARRILIVVGAPQAQHLQMCFAVARMAGWLPEDGQAVHVSFGNVLGPDHKLLRSRTGEAAKLVELLDEAVTRAERALEARDAELEPTERQRLASVLGIGAVKYADLSTERTKDYVFDWDRMLAFEGNTGPYLQYAYARIRSLFRRAADEGAVEGDLRLADGPERTLALALLGFRDAIAATLDGYTPSKLCGYLFDLAGAFTAFYENCPVLRGTDDATRASRLALAGLTARVLAQGLDLLGMVAPERM